MSEFVSLCLVFPYPSVSRVQFCASQAPSSVYASRAPPRVGPVPLTFASAGPVQLTSRASRVPPGQQSLQYIFFRVATHHGRLSPLICRGRPCPQIHRGRPNCRLRHGHRPGGHLSRFQVPWGLQSASPPPPPPHWMLYGAGRACWGGGDFRFCLALPCVSLPLYGPSCSPSLVD